MTRSKRCSLYLYGRSTDLIHIGKGNDRVTLEVTQSSPGGKWQFTIHAPQHVPIDRESRKGKSP